MRTYRPAATAALFALTASAMVLGTATAFADAATPSPSASAVVTSTPSATATSSAEPEPTVGPTSTTTLQVTTTGSPTVTPTATPTLPQGCTDVREEGMPVHGVTLGTDGSTRDMAVSFYNSGSTTLTDFRITGVIRSATGAVPPTTEVRFQGDTAWAPVTPDPATGSVSLGHHRIPSHEMFTVVLRISADPAARAEGYILAVSGVSEALPYGVGATDAKHTCTRLAGSSTGRVTFREEPAATASPSASAPPTASVPPTASASPSATPTAVGVPVVARGTGTTAETGGGLAETGGSSTTAPLAVTGVVAIVLGCAAALVAHRRRNTRG
ncbi:hypothetical protein ACWEQL_24470 [Kitasatospora sp. NPDC004240]